MEQLLEPGMPTLQRGNQKFHTDVIDVLQMLLSEPEPMLRDRRSSKGSVVDQHRLATADSIRSSPLAIA